MKKITLTLISLFIIHTAFCQSKPDSGKVVYKSFADYNDLRKQHAQDHIAYMCYIDSTYNFKVVIPSWLYLKETDSRLMIGGTLPAVGGVENTILIKIFEKKNYPNLEAFKNYVIGDWTYMTHPKWSSEALCYGKKELSLFENIGYCCRASNAWRNHMYTCTYVLVETKTAYLWIDYTSTPALYEINEKKFEEFMSGFEKTNF
jgi:hypothetical protein